MRPPASSHAATSAFVRPFTYSSEGGEQERARYYHERATEAVEKAELFPKGSLRRWELEQRAAVYQESAAMFYRASRLRLGIEPKPWPRAGTTHHQPQEN